MQEEMSAGKGEQSKAVSLDQIRNQCLDSQGYVLFAGILSPDRDAQGNNIINFHYIRQNFSFEDTRRGVDEFKKALIQDVSAE